MLVTGSQPTDLEASRRFAAEVAWLLSQTRCHNVVVLDVSGLSPVTDFLVLATGTSDRQMKSACDDVQEFGEPRGYKSLTRSGDHSEWMCIDLVDIVVHVFTPESRAFYDLEGLWGDAARIAWKEYPAPNLDEVLGERRSQTTLQSGY